MEEDQSLSLLPHTPNGTATNTINTVPFTSTTNAPSTPSLMFNGGNWKVFMEAFSPPEPSMLVDLIGAGSRVITEELTVLQLYDHLYHLQSIKDPWMALQVRLSLYCLINACDIPGEEGNVLLMGVYHSWLRMREELLPHPYIN